MNELLDVVSTRRVTLLMGAGCSVTAGVPLAKGILDDLGPQDVGQTYFGAMQSLNPIRRRELFAKYIRQARINVSSFIAARLLCERRIECVVTTNFDDLVPRAVGLSVQSVPIYDATLAVPQEGIAIVRPSIVYLHGQVHGFWQLNTYGEFDRCAGTVRRLLRDAIHGTAVVVIGYSGNDHVVEMLAEEVRHTHGVYWVQFRREPVSDRVGRAFAESDGLTYVEDDLTSDAALYAIAKHYGVLEKYNSKFFSEVLEKLSNIASEVELRDGRVDVLGQSKNRSSTAKDAYEDNAVRVTKATHERDTRWDEVVGVAVELGHDIGLAVASGWKPSAELLMRVARTLRTAGRGSGAKSAMDRAIALAVSASGADDARRGDVAMFVATTLSETGKMTRDPGPFAAAEPHYEQAVTNAEIEAERVAAIGNWAMSRHDLANVLVEAGDVARGAVELALRGSRLMFESVVEKPEASAKLVNNYSSLLIDMGRLLQRPELFDEAIVAASKANDRVHGAGAYNLACCYALKSEQESALQWIERAIAARRHRPEQFLSDPDFMSLRDDPRFVRLLRPEASPDTDASA